MSSDDALVLRPTVVPYVLAPLGGLVVWLLGCLPADVLGFGVPWLVAVALAVMLAWLAAAKQRVVIDDHGVERRGLLGVRRLAWSDIAHYRYAGVVYRSLAHHGAAARRLVRSHGVDLFEGRHVLVLQGPSGARLALASRFGGAGQATSTILAELHRRYRAAPGDKRLTRFGPLTLAPDALTVEGKGALPRGEVESLDILGGTNLRLRVMKRGKILPWASFRLDAVPNAMLLLEQAVELGYVCTLGGGVVPSPGLADRLAAQAQLPTARLVERD